MKIQLNTAEKTIKLEENIKLGELFSKLEEMFPELAWREYTLETGTIINWTTPVPYIPYVPTYPENPYCPWTVTYGDGTYNISII